MRYTVYIKRWNVDCSFNLFPVANVEAIKSAVAIRDLYFSEGGYIIDNESGRELP